MTTFLKKHLDILERPGVYHITILEHELPRLRFGFLEDDEWEAQRATFVNDVGYRAVDITDGPRRFAIKDDYIEWQRGAMVGATAFLGRCVANLNWGWVRCLEILLRVLRQNPPFLSIGKFERKTSFFEVKVSFFEIRPGGSGGVVFP